MARTWKVETAVVNTVPGLPSDAEVKLNELQVAGWTIQNTHLDVSQQLNKFVLVIVAYKED